MISKNNKKALSVTLFADNFRFLSEESKKRKTTKTDVVNYALDMYRKYKLKQEIQEGFKSQSKEDLDLAMSDFDDYFNIVKSIENETRAV